MGSSVFLHIKAEGSPEPTIQWFKNGYLVPGALGPIYHLDNVNKSHEGTYTCEVKNMAGSFIWQEAAVSVRALNYKSG
jgi:hypothetical protein